MLAPLLLAAIKAVRFHRPAGNSIFLIGFYDLFLDRWLLLVTQIRFLGSLDFIFFVQLLLPLLRSLVVLGHSVIVSDVERLLVAET